MTAELSTLAPEAADYFARASHARSPTSMKPYDDAIAPIKAGASGKTYAATESVFDYMAAAVGLQNKTPAGLPGRREQRDRPVARPTSTRSSNCSARRASTC